MKATSTLYTEAKLSNNSKIYVTVFTSDAPSLSPSEIGGNGGIVIHSIKIVQFNECHNLWGIIPCESKKVYTCIIAYYFDMEVNVRT